MNDIKNNLLLGSRSLIILCLGLTSTTYLFNFLGSQNYGNYVYVESIFLFLLFIEAGLISSFLNEINRHRKTKATFSRPTILISVISSIILGLLIIIFNFVLSRNDLITPENLIYFILGYSFLLSTKIIFSKINAVLIYEEKIFHYSVIALIPGISKLLAILTLIYSESLDFLTFFLVYCSSDILLRCCILFNMSKSDFISITINSDKEPEVKTLIQNTSTDGLSNFIDLSVNTLLKIYAGPVLLATYSIVKQFKSVIEILIANLNVSLKAKMAQLKIKNESLIVALKAYNIFSLIGILCSLLTGVVLLSFQESIFNAYLGKIPFKASFFIVSLMTLSIIQSKLKLLSSLAISFGNYKEYNLKASKSLLSFFTMLILIFIFQKTINEYSIMLILNVAFYYSLFPRLKYFKNLFGADLLKTARVHQDIVIALSIISLVYYFI